MSFSCVISSIPWIHIKPLILHKFNQIMDEFVESVDENRHPNSLALAELTDLRKRVYRTLNHFEGYVPLNI